MFNFKEKKKYIIQEKDQIPFDYIINYNEKIIKNNIITYNLTEEECLLIKKYFNQRNSII